MYNYLINMQIIKIKMDDLSALFKKYVIKWLF